MELPAYRSGHCCEGNDRITEIGEDSMEDKSIILEMKNISKSFPGVKALNSVSFTLRRGTVHALMGENGAGKSTLMKCAFGLYEDRKSVV